METPLLLRLKARNLYLVQGLGHKEIGAQIGISEHASQQLAFREGWTELRKKSKRDLLSKQDARMAAAQSEALDAIASVSEQHAIKGLERVGEALEARGEFAARDFQSFTSGVKNLVSIMREIRTPDAQQTPGSSQLNVFVMRVGDVVKPTERNVTPNTQSSVASASTPVLVADVQ